MRDFEASTLWRVSEFERERMRTGSSGFARLEGASVLSSTLHADLSRLNDGGVGADLLEVVAACMRNHEPALLCLRYDGLVWPVTLFPAQQVYHSPRGLHQVAVEPLASASTDLLVCALGPTIQRYLAGDLADGTNATGAAEASTGST